MIVYSEELVGYFIQISTGWKSGDVVRMLFFNSVQQLDAVFNEVSIYARAEGDAVRSKRVEVRGSKHATHKIFL